MTIGINSHSGKARDRAECTPLYLAISTGQLPMVNLLLKYKADPNDFQTDGRPVLFSALSDTNILEMLLDGGGKVDSRTFGTPLLGAAVGGNNPASVQILLRHGADVNIRDNGHRGETDGSTPLHIAAQSGADRKMFELLLDWKADPNVRDNSGNTPLDLVKRHARYSSDSQTKTEMDQVIALLHAHGALDDLPDFKSIRVDRQGLSQPIIVFHADTNGWNRFTLFETILSVYSRNTSVTFPALDRIIVHRPSSKAGVKEQQTIINLLNATNGVDCAKDIPLEFGDVVEIPMRDHALNAMSRGLSLEESWELDSCLKRSVELKVRGQSRILQVAPTSSNLRSALSLTDAQSLLLSSSDLTRVKVTRHDPKTGKKLEWILDCSGSNAPDLWLRDGDVIEVPEKQDLPDL